MTSGCKDCQQNHQGYWDLPGGHVQDGENLEQALRREVKEETSLDIEDAEQTLVKIMTLGEETKPVVFFNATASGHVTCSEEHIGHQWADDDALGGINLGVFKAVLIPTAQERSEYTSSGTEMPASERGGDGQLFTRSIVKGQFDSQEEALTKLGLKITDQRDDGDVIAHQPEGDEFYVTADGRVYQYYMGDTGPDGPVMDKATPLAPRDQKVGKVGEQSGVVNPRLRESLKKVEKILRPPVDDDVLQTEADVAQEDDAQQRFDGPKGDTYETEPSVGGRRGVGSGAMGKDISGAGDTMVGEEVHTPVGGGGRRRRAHKMKLIKTTINKAFEPSSSLRLIKTQAAVHGDLARYDMVVLNKAMPDGRVIVAGYASPVLVDQEGHRITHEALAKDLPRFMADGGKYANVNVMHSNVTVGRIIPSFTDKSGKVWKTEVNDQGLFVVAEIRTDPAAPGIVKQVIDDVESGKLRSFSISGNADNPTFTCDGDRCFYDINELELYEITLCEEGVNQEAKFDIISKAMTKNADAPAMPAAELLRYFGAFSTLFQMHHDTGIYSVVLYDRSTGEILEVDDTIELVDVRD